MFTAVPVITEFLASNDTILVDEDGGSSDWIEVYNAGDTALDLNGWHLTDDAAELDQWAFPDVSLAAGGYLVVFASGKDRADADGTELHTNFALRAGGEYLALVEPDGTTVAYEYAPEYPEQAADVSYGVSVSAVNTTLVDTDSPARVHVPADGALGAAWQLQGFNDAAWTAGPLPVGFETGIADAGEGAHVDFTTGTSSQLVVATHDAYIQRGSPNTNFGNAQDLIVKLTSNPQFQRKAYVGFDFDPSALGALADAELRLGVTATDQTYTVNVYGINESADNWTEGAITWDNAPGNDFISGGGTPGSGGGVVASDTTYLGQITVTTGDVGGVVTFSNADSASPDALVQFLQTQSDGDASFILTRVESFDPNLLTFASREAANVSLRPRLELSTADVVGIGTDVEVAMRGVNTTAYVRVPFTVADVNDIDRLELDIRADDGFVAYLNGQEVARRNAPGTLAFNSAATTFNLDADALAGEVINISAGIGALQNGGNVLAIHALNHTVNGNDFLVSPRLIATQVTTGLPQYFTVPTPGADNDPSGGFLGIVEDTKFSIDRGVYSAPIDVEITSATVGASIFYTLDGSDPVPGNTGTQFYSPGSPINISSTTTLRAIAFLPGFQPTNIDTQTYIFPADVLAQPSNPAGYPAIWGGANGRLAVTGDYEIDPQILGMHTGQELLDAFTEIPTLALTLPIDDLFDPNNGIYANANQGGAAWERATAVEFFEADGSDGFGLNAGVRIHGGFSREVSNGTWNSFKQSFRLVFKEEYGPTKLEYPLFAETSEIDSINTLILDAYWQNSLQHNNPPFALNAQYVRDILASDLQASTGSYSVNHRYSHLYLNGEYWGLYVLHERPDDAALSEQLGGAREDYDVIHNSVNDVIAGSNSDLVTLFNLANGNVASPAVYAQIQDLLDVEQFANYAVISTWGSARDWTVNWYAARNRTADTPFQFYTWDTELILSDLGENSFGGSGSNPEGLLEDLRGNEEFRMLFADSAHRMLFNDGILSPNRASEFLENRLTQIEDAVVLEYARWGDLRQPTNPYTVADWEAERNQLNTSHFPQRFGIYLNQLLSVGFYPSTAAVSWNQRGGAIGSGFNLQLTAPQGTIYYTTDGSDPRLVGGAVSGSATQYNGTFQLADHATVRARVLHNGVWSAIDEADFVIADMEADNTNLRITELHYNPVGATPAEIAAGFTDGDQFEFIELLNTSSDTISLDGVTLDRALVGRTFEGISFEFGLTALDPGERLIVASDTAAFTERYGTGINIAGEYTGKLSNGGERVELVDADGFTIHAFTYEDGDDPGEEAWATSADGDGPSLVVVDTEGDYDDGANWFASATTHGTPGADEVSAIPADMDGDGDVDDADFGIAFAAFTGPNNGPSSNPAADLDGDGDVDDADFGLFFAAFTGPLSQALAGSSSQTEPQQSSLHAEPASLASAPDLAIEPQALTSPEPLARSADTPARFDVIAAASLAQADTRARMQSMRPLSRSAEAGPALHGEASDQPGNADTLTRRAWRWTAGLWAGRDRPFDPPNPTVG